MHPQKPSYFIRNNYALCFIRGVIILSVIEIIVKPLEIISKVKKMCEIQREWWVIWTIALFITITTPKILKIKSINLYELDYFALLNRKIKLHTSYGRIINIVTRCIGWGLYTEGSLLFKLTLLAFFNNFLEQDKVWRRKSCSMDKILNKLNSGFENKYITFFNLFGLLPAMLHLL